MKWGEEKKIYFHIPILLLFFFSFIQNSLIHHFFCSFSKVFSHYFFWKEFFFLFVCFVYIYIGARILSYTRTHKPKVRKKFELLNQNMVVFANALPFFSLPVAIIAIIMINWMIFNQNKTKQKKTFCLLCNEWKKK